ncbi:MAG TPA: hypothetical protein VMD04_02680 [Candidatus Margulisiibacteriota bacterium]|nr:hypothetical protein [Candidatus Margulisiibacteriota bacterium]
MVDNYLFKKRQREIAQKKKREQKLQRKMEKKNSEITPIITSEGTQDK